MKYLYNYKLFEGKNKFVNFKTFDLKKWFDKLNKEFFNNRLREVPLRWNQAKTSLGVVKWDEKTGVIEHLGISDRYKLTQEELLSVLAHEMIHVWQIQNNKMDGHGNYFTKELERINDKSKWGINVYLTQPIEHLKMTNPDLNRDFGFIAIKNKKGEFTISIYDPNKTDYKSILTILQQNLDKGESVDVEVRLTQNGMVKQYDKESTNDRLFTHNLDELTFNSLMISSKKIYGGNVISLKDKWNN